MKEKREYLTVAQAGALGEVTSYAIYSAIKQGRLKAYREPNGRWLIKSEDYDEYRAHRYSRRNIKHQGELVYDPCLGLLSPPQVAVLFSAKQKFEYSVQRIYFAIRTGKLKAHKRGSVYVITYNDAMEFYEQECGLKTWPGGRRKYI